MNSALCKSLNLLFDSVTSLCAIQGLLRVQKNDPELWGKISADPLHYNINGMTMRTRMSFSDPFKSNCYTQDDLDLATLPSVLIDAFLHDNTSPNTGGNDNLPLAEQLDPGEVNIPTFGDPGFRKHCIWSNA
jgi:hypothetical protein